MTERSGDSAGPDERARAAYRSLLSGIAAQPSISAADLLERQQAAEERSRDDGTAAAEAEMMLDPLRGAIPLVVLTVLGLVLGRGRHRGSPNR